MTKVRQNVCKEDIKAMIWKRGATLRQISLRANLSMETASLSLGRPIPAANSAIADFLGKSLHDLWPRWYDQNGNRITNHKHGRTVTQRSANRSVQKAVEEEGTQMMLSGVYEKVIAAQEVAFPRRAETFDHAEDAAYLEETKVGVGDGKKGGGSTEPPAVARRITEENDNGIRFFMGLGIGATAGAFLWVLIIFAVVKFFG